MAPTVQLPETEQIPEWLLDWPIVLVSLIVLVGVLAGFLLGRVSRSVLEAAGIPESVEGTAFERTAQSLGTSTVSIVSRLLSWFVYGVTLLAAIFAFQPTDTNWLWQRIVAFIPQVFIALLVVVLGFVVADKAELLVSERLRGVKLPEVSVLPKIVKYSVLYVAFLVALGQIGVATGALLVLLGIYVLGVVLLGAVATKDILSAGAAGIYLLLREPYGIGDRVTIGEREGVVQEVGVLVTHLEDEDAEYVVPNDKVFEHGVRRLRN
ncbi:MscS Mechanosensitive ion channel [Salinarchaeum sp. Harcht-Bsk1]|uniref:mechanosensitive ion channel domain-containing protein n=1 Tax=Salinarchaeum sp. Harcht-Bsk1 TaxID=1333523 RepID=UPI00034231BB|nr:mechanosensitive ion channel domain-containing protein [Salinarchaeum sp. Harcht-Bsk1]AGN00413.1 MscS Mechanosensitive ion channel [Salinarchaeum sp. Harcht-Bsk1]